MSGEGRGFHLWESAGIRLVEATGGDVGREDFKCECGARWHVTYDRDRDFSAPMWVARPLKGAPKPCPLPEIRMVG